MAGAAPWFADSLGASAATGPVRVMALTVLLAGYSVVPNAMLIRGFRQDKRLLVEIAHFVAATAVLLGLATAGAGVYTLAWSRVVGQLVALLFLLRVSPSGHRRASIEPWCRNMVRVRSTVAAATSWASPY